MRRGEDVQLGSLVLVSLGLGLMLADAVMLAVVLLEAPGLMVLVPVSVLDDVTDGLPVGVPVALRLSDGVLL